MGLCLSRWGLATQGTIGLRWGLATQGMIGLHVTRCWSRGKLMFVRELIEFVKGLWNLVHKIWNKISSWSCSLCSHVKKSTGKKIQIDNQNKTAMKSLSSGYNMASHSWTQSNCGFSTRLSLWVLQRRWGEGYIVLRPPRPPNGI